MLARKDGCQQSLFETRQELLNATTHKKQPAWLTIIPLECISSQGTEPGRLDSIHFHLPDSSQFHSISHPGSVSEDWLH